MPTLAIHIKDFLNEEANENHAKTARIRADRVNVNLDWLGIGLLIANIPISPEE
jgi:hypothetical protein